MTPQAAIRNHLLASSEIAALVAGRISPDTLGEAPVYPAIAYHQISTAPYESMEGGSGLEERRYQFDICALTALTREQLAELVRLRLQGFAGVMGTNEGIVGVTVQQVSYIAAQDDYFDGLEPPVYQRSMDFIFSINVERN